MSQAPLLEIFVCICPYCIYLMSMTGQHIGVFVTLQLPLFKKVASIPKNFFKVESFSRALAGLVLITCANLSVLVCLVFEL